MVTRYRLRHPVIGFIESAKRIVTIPAAAIVTARTAATPAPGLCTVVWDGKVVQAYRMDIEQNGILVRTGTSLSEITQSPYPHPSDPAASP